jgi:hypothetical protein
VSAQGGLPAESVMEMKQGLSSLERRRHINWQIFTDLLVIGAVSILTVQESTFHSSVSVTEEVRFSENSV